MRKKQRKRFHHETTIDRFFIRKKRRSELLKFLRPTSTFSSSSDLLVEKLFVLLFLELIRFFSHELLFYLLKNRFHCDCRIFIILFLEKHFVFVVSLSFVEKQSCFCFCFFSVLLDFTHRIFMIQAWSFSSYG